MSKKYKIALSIIGILIILLSGLFVYHKFFYETKEIKKTVKTEVLEAMDEYGYTLDDRDPKIFKDKYYELKEILDKEEIDYEAYAKALASLFAIDLLNIDSKINKYDVGGVEYLYDNDKEVFQAKVQDTLYQTVEDNSYGLRKQVLPVITSTSEELDKMVKEEVDGIKKDVYIIKVTLEYEKDLGYDKNLIIKVCKDDNKMYIIEYATNK